MKNFLEEYEKAKEIRRNFGKARKENNEAEMQAAIIANNEHKKEIEKKGKKYNDIYKLYEAGRERGNIYIDLDANYTEAKIEEIIKNFREYEIEFFTFSSSWSGANETAWAIRKSGCRLKDIIEINSKHDNGSGDGYDKTYGYLFQIINE